jgi:uncharacterized protein YqeY
MRQDFSLKQANNLQELDKLLKQQQERSKQYAAAAATGRQELANALRRDLGLRTPVSFASTSPGGIIIP